MNEVQTPPHLLFCCSHVHAARKVQQGLWPCGTGRRFRRKTGIFNSRRSPVFQTYVHVCTQTSHQPLRLHPSSSSSPFLFPSSSFTLISSFSFISCFLLNHWWSLHCWPFISLIRSNSSTTAHCHSTSCLKKKEREKKQDLFAYASS